MVTVLQTELTKLHRSLALLLALSAPGFVGLFLLLNGLRDGQHRPRVSPFSGGRRSRR
jgi:hypothetical protein